MRNPFKRVYCEDCQNIMLATQYTDSRLRLEGAKCKADPRITNKHISKKENVDYWYCSSRLFPFCFKFVIKGEQDNADL